MQNLSRALQDSDPNLLPILVQAWGVDASLSGQQRIEHLTDAMLDPEKIEKAWEKLDDQQRGALQLLLGSGGKMPASGFERLYGEIRQMGKSQLEKEQPHLNPGSIAEALYYRGLVTLGFEQANAGPRRIVFVPDDLKRELPTHKTAYENLEVESETEEAVVTLPDVPAESVQAADTSLVDDMTTLLAYLQVYGAGVEGNTLLPDDHADLAPLMLTPGEERLTFLFSLGVAMGLIDINNAAAYPNRVEARTWLGASRSTQVQQMAQAWLASTVYRELWHVPGLFPDKLEGYDPAAVRETVVGILQQMTPESNWWSVESLIETVRAVEPDFQRPSGDYESWYIRNADGDYLHGFDSWDAVEGAVLEFYLAGPMHWLGLTDLGPDAIRFTAYGRAFVAQTAFPQAPDPEDKAELRPDGTLLISRKTPRIDRFQAARFTTWAEAGDPYAYVLDEDGMKRAGEQGINGEQIVAFLTRVTGKSTLPEAVMDLLNISRGKVPVVQAAGGSATMQTMIVLRTTSRETADRIWDDPALRRFVGARLGSMALSVLPDTWEEFADALRERNIRVEIPE